MPFIEQRMIYREDLRANPHVLYVFGDNVQRKGLGGQAQECRGQPNAVGVATKYLPSMSRDAFFGDSSAEVEAQKRIIDEDMKPLFDKVKVGGVVVWPAADIGTGLSDLPARSPSTWAYLQQKKSALIKTAEMFDKENDDA